MSFQEYAINDAVTQRTDVDIAPAAMVDMFSRVQDQTQILFACATIGWLKSATSQFQTIFSCDRRLVSLGFLMHTDAFASNYILHELSRAPLTYSPVLESLPNDFVSPQPLTSTDLSAIPGRLVSWLDITYEQLSNITGVSRSALFYWKHGGTSPRPGNVERLERLYAVTSLLVKRLDARGARVWLQSGDSPVWTMLLAGDLAAVEAAVQQAFFKRPAAPLARNDLRLREVALDLPTHASGASLGTRRAERKATRKRLRPE